MRIGLFTDTYPPFINGVSTSVLMLKQGLEELGHEVFVVTVNSESFSYSKEKNILRLPGIPVGIFDYRVTSLYPIKARSIIKSWNLDVIHTHTEFGVGTFARLLSKQYNIPLVHTYHTMYEEYVYYITKGYFDGASKKLVEYLTLFLCDKTIDELIVPTKKTYDLFKEKYKVKRNVHIIPTGIDIKRFYKENVNLDDVLKLKTKLGLSKKDYIIMYLGRVSKEKNIEFLIDNLKDISKKIPKVKLLIVGDGPDMDYLMKIVHDNKLNNNVVFVGKVPWQEVPKYYHLCDLFVTASKTETQGLTVLEAMASSKIVIAINDESFINVIKDGQDGYIFNNEKEYKNIIYDLYNDKKKSEYISKQARISANNYSLTVYAQRVLEVYKLVLNKDTNILKKISHKIKNQIKKDR